MLYIPQEERPEIVRAIDALYIDSPGKLAYGIARLIRKFFRGQRGPIGYAGFAMVSGVLITAQMELYRRGIAPYEDMKLQQNGDVE